MWVTASPIWGTLKSRKNEYKNSLCYLMAFTIRFVNLMKAPEIIIIVSNVRCLCWKHIRYDWKLAVQTNYFWDKSMTRTFQVLPFYNYFSSTKLLAPAKALLLVCYLHHGFLFSVSPPSNYCFLSIIKIRVGCASLVSKQGFENIYIRESK